MIIFILKKLFNFFSEKSFYEIFVRILLGIAFNILFIKYLDNKYEQFSSQKIKILY